MTKKREELLTICKTLEAEMYYILETVHIAQKGSDFEVSQRLYEIDEIIGGRQCLQKSK